jgi:DNA repair protein SbcC/Rad50
MRLHSLRLSGITEAFPTQVSVDFDALGHGLIALVGDNGVGKSTLIGSVFAALFRQLPGQKRSLYDFCTHAHPQIDLTFSVGGESYRSLLKIDPKARQMESYLFDGRGMPLANGKKDSFDDAVRKRVGTVELFLASIYSSQRRAGNFLGLERSERKQLFITQLLGLNRLRLISATARGFAEEADRQVVSLEGERKGLSQLLATESDIESLEELAGQLNSVSTDLQHVEQARLAAEAALSELRARDVERKAGESSGAAVATQLKKTETSIANLQRQQDEDSKQLVGQRDAGQVTEQVRTLDARIDELHRQMEGVNAIEASNREVEATIRPIEADLRARRDELARSERESQELAAVPCGGQGPYAGCVKIQRAWSMSCQEGNLSW